MSRKRGKSRKKKKSLRERDYWKYAFNKYVAMLNKAPASIRRTWTIAAIQHNAAEFAKVAKKRYGKEKAVIKFDDMGVPRVKGKEIRW